MPLRFHVVNEISNILSRLSGVSLPHQDFDYVLLTALAAHKSEIIVHGLLERLFYFLEVSALEGYDIALDDTYSDFAFQQQIVGRGP